MQQRRLAAIMFTDIVGYTALMGKDEDRAFEVLRINKEIHAQLIEKHNGTIIKELGDGILVSFDSSVDAVKCAIEIQRECKKKEIPLKIGIHEGDMVFEGNDVLGDGVNIASRLEAITEKGNISVSEAIIRNISNKPGIYAAFVEEKRLKNVKELVKVYQVSDQEIKVDKRKSQITERLFSIKSIYMGFGIGLLILVAVFVWKMLPIDEQNDLSLNTTPGNAIAVLPLKDISPEQQFEYFSEGITWEIHNNLVMIGGLVVRSRPSVEQYRNTEKDITTIGKELNSSYILSGSVQKYLDEFRVIIQLINVATNETIWSKPYGGSYNTKTIFDMQINIAREVASSLRTSLTDKDEERISFRWTNNIESYDYSIRGQHEMNNYWLKHDREHLNNALESFNKALKIDPKNTRALGGKVQVFTYLPNSDSVDFYLNKLSNLDPNLGSFLWMKADNFLMTYQYDLALEYYKKTVDFFPDDPQANVELGEIYFNYEKDIESGLKHFNLALKGAFKSTERYPFVFHKIGYSLLHAGDYERAKCYFLEAWENGALGEVWHYQWTLAVQQKHKEAYAFLDTICDQTKDELVCFWGKIFHCITQRDYTCAEEYYKVFNDKGYEANIWLQLAIACMYMNTGRKNEADLILEDCLSKLKKELEKYGETWHNALLLSELFAIKDDKDKALEYLSKAVDFGVLWGWQDMMEFSPMYENLWDEPEFKALVQRAKDEKAAIRAKILEMEERGEIDLSL